MDTSIYSTKTKSNDLCHLLSHGRYSLGEKLAGLRLQQKNAIPHLYLYISYTPHNTQHHTHSSKPNTTPILHTTPKPHGPVYTRRAIRSTQSRTRTLKLKAARAGNCSMRG